MSRSLIPTNDLPLDGKLNSLTYIAADSSNNHYYVDDGSTVLVAICGDSATKTVTVVSVADALGRTGDMVLTVPANDTNNDGLSFFGLPSGAGWRQAGGNNVNVNVSANTKLKLAALRVNRAR